METHILRGKNILLRAPEPADIDFIGKMENDPDIWHYGNTLIPYSRYQIEQYVMSTQHDLYSEKQLRMMIETNRSGEGNKVVGAIDLFDFDPHHRRAAIGILIAPQEREKGYAREALHLLIDYCFQILRLHQLYCEVIAGNIASIQLFEKAGFTRSGIKKEWIVHHDAWLDEIMFQLLNK